MVHTPRCFLVSAIMALVALQTPQVSATSIDYDPITTSGTDDKISKKFPGYGAEIADEDCAYTVQTDPTLPDIMAISLTPVTYTDLLANTTTPPTEPVFTKVGIATLSQDMPLRKLAVSVVSNEEQRRLETTSKKELKLLEDYFKVKMETTLAKLPTEGLYHTAPWPAPNWPRYLDSINAVWSEGQPSPAAKYARAFGLNETEFMDWVSWDSGIDSASENGTICMSDADCGSVEKAKCGIRANQTSGYCIQTWEGICHAWAPASILEKEPQCAVTYNGVTFQPMDLKALISDVYNGAEVPLVFTGTRFNRGDNSTDKYGRHVDDRYRDLNPGFFHIAAANLLGKLNTTFIIDIDAGREVWNQPVRGFKVHEQTAMSLMEAAKTFYGLKKYPWNSKAKSIVYTKTYLSWIDLTYEDGPLVSTGEVDKHTTGAYYYYLLEMDAAGRIIGGEWLYDSNSNHPDFFWIATGKPAPDTVTYIGLSYANVTMLLDEAVACTETKAMK
ncbi:hypothetical protein PHYBOEH_008611 [Phytophthora boehmeriae]|uniref:Transglutaminase elicitor n=1 Tax=Phytophthora boehmeriae TaxID=109152 RepID=A0A8T1VYU8_9STRA|nr:hypothetical protein PHYBOEH_008611 [Phytophthora boehmeriae]